LIGRAFVLFKGEPRAAIRVALLGRNGPTGTFARWENERIGACEDTQPLLPR
jgi:hypothetical protein